MKETINKVRKLLKPIIRLSIAFAATAILFQLTTNVKLFNMDVVSNTSKFMNDIVFRSERETQHNLPIDYKILDSTIDNLLSLVNIFLI